VSAAADARGRADREANASVAEGRVLAVLGPTASGKSSLALDIARARIASGRPTEIVAIDAFTVYRGMDVATAKPGPDERALVPHHMVDVLDPADELTVVRFRSLARAAIAEVHGRGATALLVGGSGLYWRAVVDELSFPPTDAAVRASIEARIDGDAVSAHAELAVVDPQAADDIGTRNLRRIIRALEVVELTGRPFSSWDDAWSRYEAIYPDLSIAYLEPAADDLRAAIAARAERMVTHGLLDEATVLRSQVRSRTAAAAIGYAEAEAVLDGREPSESLASAIAERTWRYARRQRSWFRADPRCVVTSPADVLSAWA
jgi:tRNA dimethylallyltransferase